MKHFFLVSALLCGSLFAEESFVFRRGETGPYSFNERSDWRRYDNGKYTGLTRREVRASILPVKDGAEGYLYRGNFIVLEATLRDMQQSAKAVNAVVPAFFRVNTEGYCTIEEDKGFPSFRNFPVFPSFAVKPGARWTAEGTRAIDPLNTGRHILIPISAEYTFVGLENYHDEQVYKINAKYVSTRIAPNPDLSRVQGTHVVDLLIRVEDGLPVFMRDNLDETYFKPDGSMVRFVGFTLSFRENIRPLDKASVVKALEPKPKKPEKPVQPVKPEKPLKESAPDLGSDVEVAEVPEGLKLTIKDVRFKADSDEFLPTEKPRLDLIADALLRVPDKDFLVEGHTAAVNTPAEELELSVLRAKRFIKEMKARGLSEDRFLFKGWGGTKPIADNATPEGRAKNRRVEITILE